MLEFLPPSAPPIFGCLPLVFLSVIHIHVHIQAIQARHRRIEVGLVFVFLCVNGHFMGQDGAFQFFAPPQQMPRECMSIGGWFRERLCFVFGG